MKPDRKEDSSAGTHIFQKCCQGLPSTSVKIRIKKILKHVVSLQRKKKVPVSFVWLSARLNLREYFIFYMYLSSRYSFLVLCHANMEYQIWNDISIVAAEDFMAWIP